MLCTFIEGLLNSRQRSGIAAGREFIARQALELKPIEKLNYKIRTKSPTGLMYELREVSAKRLTLITKISFKLKTETS